MPKLEGSLASQRMQTQRSRGTLMTERISPGPGLLSSSAGRVSATVSAPQLSLSAGDVKYTPIQPNDIVVDKSLDALAQMGNVWVESAFKFQQRQEKATADELVLAYQEEIRKAQTGYVDENGQSHKGYLYKEMREATNLYDPHRELIEGSFKKMLDNTSPNVRQHAILRMLQTRNSALDRATKHNVQQFARVEKDNLYRENKALLADIKAYGPGAYEDGSVTSHLVKYTDEAERDAAAESIGQVALWTAYNKVLKETNDPIAAYDAEELMYQSVLPTLAPASQNKFEYQLLQKRELAERAKKKVAAENLAAQRKQFDKEMPIEIASNATAANYEVLFNLIGDYRDLYKDQDEDVQTAKVVSAMAGAFAHTANNSGLVTVQQKHDAAVDLYTTIMQDNGEDFFTEPERNLIAQYVKYDLLDALVKEQKRIDVREKGELAASITSAERDGNIMQFRPAPPGMLDKDSYEQMQQTYLEELAGGVDPTKIPLRQAAAEIYKSMITDGPLTDDQLEDAFKLVADGKLSTGDYAKLVASNNLLTGPNRGAPPYRQTPQYTAAKEYIAQAKKLGLFSTTDPPADDAPPEEQVAYNVEQKLAVAKATNAMERAARMAALEKKEFSALEWWKAYQLEVINGGSKVSKGFWSSLGDWFWSD